MFVWNQSKTGSVNLEKVRNFTIKPGIGGVEVLAWFSDRESILIGKFKTDAEAKEFLEKIGN